MAYMTEVAPDLDASLKRINAALRVTELSIMVTFIVVISVIGIAFALEVTSMVLPSQLIACAVTAPLFYTSLKYTKERPPKRPLPPGAHLLFSGFSALGQSIRSIRSENPELVKCILGIMFLESANSNIVNSSIVLFTQVLKIERPALLIIGILLLTIPSAAIAPQIQTKLGLKNALLLVLGANILGSLLVVFFIYKRERINYVWIVCVIYGFGIGSTYPIQRTLFLRIAPLGRESEMVGVLQSTSLLIVWAPALLFTALNEWLNSVRWATLAITLFHVVGFFFISSMDLKKAVADADKTAHLKYAAKSDDRTARHTKIDQVAPIGLG